MQAQQDDKKEASAPSDDKPEKKPIVVDLAVVKDKISVLKEKGNNHFRKKAFKEAIKMYSEAINIFEEAGSPTTNDDVKTVASQIFTNRAACFMSLKQYSSVISDTSTVLSKIDGKN